MNSVIILIARLIKKIFINKITIFGQIKGLRREGLLSSLTADWFGQAGLAFPTPSFTFLNRGLPAGFHEICSLA